jgi:hypothetical protein
MPVPAPESHHHCDTDERGDAGDDRRLADALIVSFEHGAFLLAL